MITRAFQLRNTEQMLKVEQLIKDDNEAQDWPRWYKADAYIYEVLSPARVRSYRLDTGKVMREHDPNSVELISSCNDRIPAAEAEALIAAAKANADPYPHYCKPPIDRGSAVVFSAKGNGRWTVNTLGNIVDDPTIFAESYFTRLTPAEFDARVKAAGEKGKWAAGSRWTTISDSCVCEWTSEYRWQNYYKNGDTSGLSQNGVWVHHSNEEITPARAREIMDGWAKEREVRCFEYNGVYITLNRFVGGVAVDRKTSDGLGNTKNDASSLRFYKKFATEFPPAEWDERVAKLTAPKYRPWTAGEAIGQKVRKKTWTVPAKVIISVGVKGVQVAGHNSVFLSVKDGDHGTYPSQTVFYPTLLRDWETIDGQKCGVKL